jgi:methylase of polypeptide subunit release factors
MQTSAAEMLALQRATEELERPVAALEERLQALSLALRERDADRIETEAAALHRALATAVDQFGRAARHGAIPVPLRHRLMAAGAQVAAQREVLARATASLDRAMEVLLPAPSTSRHGVYSAAGAAVRATHSGETQA